MEDSVEFGCVVGLIVKLHYFWNKEERRKEEREGTIIHTLTHTPKLFSPSFDHHGYSTNHKR